MSESIRIGACDRQESSVREKGFWYELIPKSLDRENNG